MFSSLGLFRQIKCPKQDECGLPACIFSHIKPNCDDVVQADEYDPFSTSYLSPPPAKKMKFDREAIIADVQTQAARMPNPKATGSTTDSLKAIAAVAPSEPTKRVASQSQTSNTPRQQPQKISNSATAVRPISPPPVKPRPKPEITNPASAKKEILSARIVPAPPVQLKARNLILQRYYAELQKQNKKVADGGLKWEAFILGDQELITFALDEEEDAARKYNAAVYRNNIGSRMVKVKNMKQDDWRTFIHGTIRKLEKAPSTTFVQPPPRPSTGLSNLKEDVAVLRGLKTSLHGLEKFGYITSPPTAQEIATAKAGVDAAAGYELCDRCNTRFRVFPGRDEEGIGRRSPGLPPPKQIESQEEVNLSIHAAVCHLEARAA
jgi:RNA exonuclease 1